MKIQKKNFIGIIFAVVSIVSSFIFMDNIGNNLFYFITVISLVIAILPFVLTLMSMQGIQKEKDSKFL